MAHGDCYGIAVLEEVAESTLLCDAERKWIAHGRAMGLPLTNGTDGGDGGTTRAGVPNSQETRAKISASKKGKPARADVAAALRTMFSGRKHSAETIEKMSAVKRGKVFSEETKAKISASRKGTVQSPELIEKRIAPLRGRTLTDTVRANISAALKGKPRPWVADVNRSRIWTPEMRANASRSARRRSSVRRVTMRLNLAAGGC